MKKIALAGLLGVAAFTAQADRLQLASLAAIDGKVLVNKGKGFVSAKPGMPLEDGDRVISLDGSRASVVYPDGCVTQIKENSLLAMDRAAGCNKEPVKTGSKAQPLQFAQAIGGSAVDKKPAPLPPGSPPPGAPPPVAGAGHLPVLIGGGLMLGGMLLDTRNISPQ